MNIAQSDVFIAIFQHYASNASIDEVRELVKKVNATLFETPSSSEEDLKWTPEQIASSMKIGTRV